MHSDEIESEVQSLVPSWDEMTQACDQLARDLDEFDGSEESLRRLLATPTGRVLEKMKDERIRSAAPDLLEALKGILEDDSKFVSLEDQRKRWNSRMEAARAAVAKAEGTNA